MRAFFRYYKNAFVSAFKHAYGYADFISFFVALALGIVGKYYPKEGAAMSDYLWQLPLMALGVVFAVRLILAPYWMHQEACAKRDRDLSELANKVAEADKRYEQRVRRFYLREEFKRFLKWGEDVKDLVKWKGNMASQKHSLWIHEVKRFLKQNPEFDESHIARFDDNQMLALKEFIHELKD
jgi:hypothetical protein